MKHPGFCVTAILSVLVLAAQPCVAQQLITGLPQFGSYQSDGFDTINLANLNIHFSVPVFSRAGRGIPFAYSLTYDGLIYTPVTSGSTTSWQPASNWGWTGQAVGTTGWLSYPSTTVNCYDSLGHQSGSVVTMGPYTYYEPSGTPHPIPYSLIIINGSHCSGNQVTQFTGMTSDGSGFTANISLSGPNKITTRSGTVLYPPTSNSNPANGVLAADANGNQITYANGVFTDTLGTALSVSGGAPNPVVYSYTAPSGGTASVTVTYKNYTVTTQFGVSGVAEYSASGVYLVDKVALPDGSYYQFWYETTGTGQPYTAGGTGPVTGRIASVRLPTSNGPVYTYGSSNSMMADGSPATLSRSYGSGTWTYQRYVRSAQGWCGSSSLQTDTTIIDPGTNYTDYYFSGLYPTGASVYAGARNQFLDHKDYCYNGNSSGCQCALIASTETTLITSQIVFDHPNDGSLYSETDSTYDSYGNLTGETDRDFGTGGPSSNPILRQTTIVESSSSSASNHSLCATYSVCNAPASIQVTDGTNQKAYTTYTYDEGGNTHGSVTTISNWTSGSSYLHQQYGYNTGGTLATSTDPNGTQTTYSYTGNSCNIAFPTSASVVGLTTQYAYNCSGGVLTSTTDPNNAITSTSYTDPFFWRPARTTDPLGNVTYYNYYGVNNSGGSAVTAAVQSESVMSVYSTSSVADNLITVDSFGRSFLSQRRQGPGLSSWDTVETDYDSSGRVSHVSLPFSSSTAAGNSGAAGSTTTYDAFGRPIQVSDSAGGITNYTYNLNDVEVAIGPAPPGENTKNRQFEYDGLGRLASVCELTSASGSGCGQNTNPGTNGYKTSYTYDPLGNLIGVNQSGQTRSYAYDGLSRMTSETNAESGTKTYQYDIVGPVACNGTGWTSKGDLLVTVDANGAATCYYSDALHRVTDVGTNRGVDRCQRFRYDNSQGYLGTRPSGITVNNSMGRLVEAVTDTCGWPPQQSYILADEWFSYDARGQATDYYQSSTNSGGWYHVKESYFPNGMPWAIQGFNGTGTSTPFSHNISASPDPEGRLLGWTDATISSVVSYNPTYNPASQPSTVAMVGAGENFVYDPNSGRMTQWQSKNTGSSSQTGSLTWNANGTLRQMTIVDTYNSGDNQTCLYGYDDLSRLLSANCSPTWSQTFSYDTMGNISKSGNVIYNPGYNANNRALTSTYDSAGNTLNDGANVYTYDARSRPATVASTQITYDAFGRMVDLNNGSSRTQIVYDPRGTKFAYMSGQNLGYYAVPLGAGLQAVFSSSGLWYYRHSDWLGSARLELDTTGSLFVARSYAPFGETFGGAVGSAGMGANDRVFTGQTQDAALGIYDFLFRQQSAAQGRWLVPDPAGLAAVDITNPQTWNRYAYVANNPLSNVDPLGLCGGTWETWDPSTNTVGSDEPCGFLPLDGPGSGSIPVHQVDPSGGGGPRGGGQSTTGSASNVPAAGPSAPGTGRTACTAAAAAIGTGVGAVVGGTVGGTAGTLGGGGVCSLFAPGVGTIGCGIVGGEVGSTAGITWGAAIGGTIGGLVGNILCSNGSDATQHGSDRMTERGISQQDIDEAISSAEATGQVTTQMGKYGTPQNIYKGANGVTVVIELAGRNAGKIITAWRQF